MADQPHAVTLHGTRTSIQLAAMFTATCANGHTHTIPVTDISDVEDAARQSGAWAGNHADTCPRTN